MLSEKYPKLNIGWGSYGGLEVRSFINGSNFTMGSYCSTAQGSLALLGGNHFTDSVTTYPFSLTEPSLKEFPAPCSRGDVVIGSDVWIATNVDTRNNHDFGDVIGRVAGMVARCAI